MSPVNIINVAITFKTWLEKPFSIFISIPREARVAASYNGLNQIIIFFDLFEYFWWAEEGGNYPVIQK